MALTGRRYTPGTRHPQGARLGPVGLPVKGESKAVGGGGGATARGGRGHGPPEWRYPAGRGGRVAPGAVHSTGDPSPGREGCPAAG